MIARIFSAFVGTRHFELEQQTKQNEVDLKVVLIFDPTSHQETKFNKKKTNFVREWSREDPVRYDTILYCTSVSYSGTVQEG